MTMHPQARTVRGSTVEEALEIARRELGVQDVRVLKASRMRRGGVGGFFAKELGVELLVAPATMQSFEEMLSYGRAHTQPETSHEYVTEAALALIESAVIEAPSRALEPSNSTPDRFERPSWAIVSPTEVLNPPVVEQRDVAAQPEALAVKEFDDAVSYSTSAHQATAESGFDPNANTVLDETMSVEVPVSAIVTETDTLVEESAKTYDITGEPAVELSAGEMLEEMFSAFETDVLSDVEASPAWYMDDSANNSETDQNVDAGTEQLSTTQHTEARGTDSQLVAAASEHADSSGFNDDVTGESCEEVHSGSFDLTATLGELLAGIQTDQNPSLFTEAQRDEELNVLHARLSSEAEPSRPAVDGDDLLRALETAIAPDQHHEMPQDSTSAAIDEAPAQIVERPRLERDAEKWQSSRALREQHTREARAERETVLEVKDSQIEAFRQRYLRPAKPAREPAPSTQSRQMVASLGSIGIPSRVMHAVSSGATLREALSSVRIATPSMEGVTLVVGHGPLVRQWALGLASMAGLTKDAVVFASMARKHHGDLCGVEQLEEWRAHNLATPVIVALDTHSPATNEGYVKRMITAVRADEVRLVLDADDERSARLWTSLAPDAALDVVRTRHAKRPGAFLQLDRPVATVDGEQATAASLALALLEHAAR
jgi:hypothetical protein